MSLQIRMAKAKSMGLVRSDVYGRMQIHPAAAQYVFGRNKRMIAGDPGFFGDIWHGITGAVGGLLTGNPLNIVTGAVKGFMSGGKAGGTTAATTGTMQGVNVNPIPINQAGLGFTLPTTGGGAVGPGLGGGINIGGPSGITIGGGGSMGGGAVGFAGGTGTAMVPAGAGGAVMSGYHLNKHGYYTKGGHYVAPRSKQVKNRRRNPLNPRALHRSLARLHSAKHAIKALHLIPPARRSAPSPFRRKARR